MSAQSSVQSCGTCKYFRQHYVKFGDDQYILTGSGHCVYPRLKLRADYAKPCRNYIDKEEEEEEA